MKKFDHRNSIIECKKKKNNDIYFSDVYARAAITSRECTIVKTRNGFRFMLLMSCIILCLNTACSSRAAAVGSTEPVDSYVTIHGALERPVRATWVWDTTQIQSNAQEVIRFVPA